MTTTPDPIAAIERALEGVNNQSAWSVEGYDDATGQVNVVGDGLYIAGVVANQPDQEATAKFIAACNPVAITALLALARQAEALERDNAEKDSRIAALEAGVSDLVEIARQHVPSIPPDGPVSAEHQAAYEATGFALVEIRNRARTLRENFDAE